MKRELIIAYLLMNCVAMSSDLGETPADLDRTYGPPVKAQDYGNMWNFRRYGTNLIVEATFRSNVCVSVKYSKLKQPNPAQAQVLAALHSEQELDKLLDRLSPEEIATLLGRNDPAGVGWKKAKPGVGVQPYERNDQKASAGYDNFRSLHVVIRNTTVTQEMTSANQQVEDIRR